MTSKEIRASFLKYFERNGHRIVPSSPLVPHDDPTLLFTNAGMNQFKDVFLGKEKRDYKRATTVQKCMRVSGKHNDLDNVGPSFRHQTFFEMLGNFSFGDYFKKEAIPFAWTLLTAEWKLPKDRLFVTIFKGEAGIERDDEAYDLWRKYLPADHIGELGSDDNFWQPGDTGPCGRSSEIYYYRGAEITCLEEAGGRTCRGMECSCDRYVELWNNVFMEFDRQQDGTLNPLPAPSVDTGMGLERVTAVLQGTLSNYDTDTFTPLLAAIGERAGTTHHGTMSETDVSMRVVADHMRAMTFLIADGVVPSNEHRGYVLRKIMRRAMRHGKHLGMKEPFLYTLVDTLVREYGDAYPELRSGREAIVQVIRSEEDRFDAVLTGGLPRLEEALERAASSGGVLSGDIAFRLYDTHGLPIDFIEDTVQARGLKFDKEAFERAMEGQREKARAKSTFKGSAWRDTAWTASDALRQELDRIGDNVFRGYESTEVNTQIIAVFDAGRQEIESLKTGQEGFVALSATPFYLEAGGQVSDEGTITSPQGDAQVTGVLRAGGWPRLHAVTVKSGTITRRDPVTASVASAVRDATRRNHTATHLLHAALRTVLGPHVKQAGSLVAPDRLRFDFVHFNAVTREQQLEIERIVNEQVLKNTPVQTDVKNTQEAIAAGAMALFGEKYGDKVRVVSIPGFSQELCGGTHVRATGDIGLFVIVSEGGVAAGVRRIEAITGLDSLKAFQRDRDELLQSAAALNARPGDLAARIDLLQEENKRLGRELQQAKMKAALSGGSSSGGGQPEVVDVAGVKLVAREVSGLDKDGLRALVDQHRGQIKSGVVVLASPSDGKVSIVVGVTPDLTKKVPAGQVVKQLAPIVGGGGGGRPDFAEAGGKDASKIGEMLAASKGVIEKMMSA
ncbi:MAG TPA: alanine--tRNA ligase [Vicinamibacterales bacterium]